MFSFLGLFFWLIAKWIDSEDFTWSLFPIGEGEGDMVF